MAEVRLEKVSKTYPDGYRAVKGIDLTIRDREFMILVGPSGCGKSTTLRMVAGLESISEGDLYIDGKRVNDISAKDRDIAMVFQSYALYPHMTIAENMGFALKLRKVPRAEIRRKVHEAAEILDVQHLLDRRPKELSGGQKQRIALGRAIVRQPKVFLLDEPLSNLDAKLRVQMRAELSKLHKRLQVTMIYVTHDQVEAMTMGDRITVLNGGEIQQVDTPLNLFYRPVNIFVAGFIGSPAMNFLPLTVKQGHAAAGDGFELRLPPTLARGLEGRAVTLGLRPRDIQPAASASFPQPGAVVSALVEMVEPVGGEAYLHLKLGEQSLVAQIEHYEGIAAEQWIDIALNLANAHLFSDGIRLGPHGQDATSS